MKISTRYSWLGDVPNAPKMILAAIALGQLDTTEFTGTKSNPEILAMAKRCDVADIYKSDETAWCALAMCDCALTAGKEILFVKYDRLRAKSFEHFGVPVPEPMFGDVCVFARPGGFHVALYIGEDDKCYHIAGGNQSNQFSVTRIDKDRLIAARRPIYKTGQPASVKKIFLEATGTVSNNES